jgi:molybdopterin converting factor small subunit
MDFEKRIEELKETNEKIKATIEKYAQEIKQMENVYISNLGRIEELNNIIKDGDEKNE